MIIKIYVQEPNGVYSHLAPFGAEEYSDLGVLEERNLLEFARQIAAGMVSEQLMYCLDYLTVDIHVV